MRPRATWSIVSLALALVLAVMAWVTGTLLELDAERTRTQQQGVVEEQGRLALWRVDSAMTPILSREVAELDEPPRSELPAPPTGVVMRFELTHESLRPLTQAEPDELAQLEAALEADELLARLEAATPITRGLANELDTDTAPPASGTPYALKPQSVRNEDEWSQRKASVEDNLINDRSLSKMRSGQESDGQGRLEGRGPEDDLDQALGYGGAGTAETGPERITIIEPVWIGDKLLLIRRASLAAGERIEGTWLDWPALREQLLDEVADLLPDADLVPVSSASDAPIERMLATLPVRLEPGATIAPPPAWSPLRASLLAAWLIVLLAFAALILLVRAALRLSERRATFVSAVTHELRTPLTTFRMYTEMLGEGMVEQKRDRYIAVLRREADRLSGLVENVLAYARIESERAAATAERMSVGLLLDRVVDRLHERCEAAGMELEFEAREDERSIELEVDPAAVEQILFNLVDNAAKYAASDDNPRIRLELEVAPRKVALHVRDFGPGVAADDVRRIFEPFTKAKADAAGTQPGVGLGLALSRRLARQMGGDLSLTSEGRGADFVLSLPRA